MSVVNSSFCLLVFLPAQAAGVKNLRKLIFLFLSSSLIKPVPLNSTVHVFIQSKLFFGRIEAEIGFHDGSVFLTLREIFGYYSKLKNYFLLNDTIMFPVRFFSEAACIWIIQKLQPTRKKIISLNWHFQL